MRNAPLRHPDKWSARLRERLILNWCAHLSSISMRHSDGIRVGVDTDQMHSDNNSMTRVARPLNDDLWHGADRMQSDKQLNSYNDDSMPLCPEASLQQLKDLMIQWLEDDPLIPSWSTTTRGLDDSMACGTIRWRDDTSRGSRNG